MGKLQRLRVERTDGVDRPATGHKWVVVKSEDAAGNVEDLAKTLVDEVVKAEVELSKDAASALVALAGALGIELETKNETPAEEPAEEAAAPVEEPSVSGLFKSA